MMESLCYCRPHTHVCVHTKHNGLFSCTGEQCDYTQMKGNSNMGITGAIIGKCGNDNYVLSVISWSCP